MTLDAMSGRVKSSHDTEQFQPPVKWLTSEINRHRIPFEIEGTLTSCGVTDFDHVRPGKVGVNLDQGENKPSDAGTLATRHFHSFSQENG